MNDTSPLYLGLDLGGTKCALVTGTKDCRVLSRDEIRTADFPDWRDALDALLRRAPRGPFRAVGVSCGGPLDPSRGLILSPPNLPGWDDVPIVQTLEERLGAPAFLQNDANACALAEWRFGAGRGCRNMAFLTFGTGLGAGLILDGRLYAARTTWRVKSAISAPRRTVLPAMENVARSRASAPAAASRSWRA